MSDSRDDFIIAIRYALLKKGVKQKFSLFFLILLSIIIIILDRSSLSVMTHVRSVLNDLVYQCCYCQLFTWKICKIFKSSNTSTFYNL